MTNNTLPVNFLYLGGDKCGSTWIWHILNQHPDVALANAKEIFYFDRFYDKGEDWYRRQFPKQPQAMRIGEICHDYLYSETALERIARDLPQDSRFLVTVRAPVARSVSHWKYMLKIGRTNLCFEDAVREYPEIVENSLFGKHVQNARNHLGANRVFVLDFDQLKTDPKGFGGSLCSALDVPFIETLPYEDRILEAQSARNPALVSVLRNGGWVLRRLGLPSLVSTVKSSPLVSKVLYTSDPAKTPPEPGAEILQELSDLFAPDQARLTELMEPGLKNRQETQAV
ncbi:sulfotransferase family protein [Ruegeria arenilitoris]|uniref:sulfotransferase family protein n=1 Tax=Ruegeria arenilitoris TaxID=1173585 RepID=UPI00148085CD